MTKDAYYFSHDANAFHDPRIIRLRAQFGLEGYGFYWAIIEMLRNQSDYCLHQEDLDLLSFHLHTDDSKIKQMLSKCYEWGLLTNEDDKVFSDSLLRRMVKADAIRKKRVDAGAKGGKAKASAKQNPSKDVALKESKVKETKEKKSKEDPKAKVSRFAPPRLEDVASYCLERKNGVDSVKWHNFYSAKDWMIGKNKMKNWKAAVRTWEDKKADTKKSTFDPATWTGR